MSILLHGEACLYVITFCQNPQLIGTTPGVTNGTLFVIDRMHANSLHISWGAFRNRTWWVRTPVQFRYQVEWMKIQFFICGSNS